MTKLVTLWVLACTMSCGMEHPALKPGIYAVDTYFHRDDWDNQTLTEMRGLKWQIGWANGKQEFNILGSSIVHKSVPYSAHEIRYQSRQTFRECHKNVFDTVLVSNDTFDGFRGYGDSLFVDVCDNWEMLTVVELYGKRIGDLP